MAVASTVLLGVYFVLGSVLFLVGGVWAAVAGIPILVGAQYLAMVQLPLWRRDGGEITREDAPELHERADEIAEKFGIAKPTLYVVEKDELNAFAVGRSGNGKVFLHSSLFQHMSLDEIEPILAHEFAHLKNRDLIVTNFGASIVSILSSLLFVLVLIASLDSDHPWLIRLVGSAVTACVHFLLLIFVQIVSRYREYIADEDAVQVTGKYDGMQSALSKLKAQKRRVNASPASTTRNAISFVNYSGGIANRLLSTHPSLDKRIDRIEQLKPEAREDGTSSELPSQESKASNIAPGKVDNLTDKQLLDRIQSMDEYAFEELVGDLWEAIGWQTTVTMESKDRGVDVVAERESPFYQKQVIQAKRYGSDNPVSSSEVQQYAGLHLQEDNVDAVVVVTTSRFTSDAQDVASDSNVKLIDGEDLCELVRTVDTDISIDAVRMPK